MDSSTAGVPILLRIVGALRKGENEARVDPVIIFSVAIVVLAITTHEAAHAWVADLLGDPTARRLGRVTLNPIPHIDLFLTIILPALLILSSAGVIFGGAKPVPVQINFLRNPRRDWALVGAAGPVSNILQAILWAGLLSALLHGGVWDEGSWGIKVLQIGIYANILLAVFNFMPIPPLDGSRVVMYFLSPKALRAYMGLERFGIFIILGLFLWVEPFRDILRGGIDWLLTLILELVAMPKAGGFF